MSEFIDNDTSHDIIVSKDATENNKSIVFDEPDESMTNNDFIPFCGDCQPNINNIASDQEIPVENISPINRLIIPEDVVEIHEDDEVVHIIGTRGAKVTKIAHLNKIKSLKELIIRSCLLSQLDGLEACHDLIKLELYDNLIDNLNDQLRYVTNLRILDLSFNALRDMSPISVCFQLQELYIAQNKLRTITGLDEMKDLMILDLGANRIRTMDGLSTLVSLKSLWLGKNKIENITDVGHLPNLRQLDVQNNRLTSLGEDLLSNQSLEEIYLACNAITSTAGLPVLASRCLKIIDLSNNKLVSLESIECFSALKELWMTGSGFSSLDELASLQLLPKLECLYLEHSPIVKVLGHLGLTSSSASGGRVLVPDDELAARTLQDDDQQPVFDHSVYRCHIKQFLPSLEQLDADLF